MAKGSAAVGEEVAEEAPAEEAAPEPPKARFFSVALEIQLVSDNQNVSAEGVEAAVKEQVILPPAVSLQPGSANILGATSGGVSESTSPTEIDDGYGRMAPPKED